MLKYTEKLRGHTLKISHHALQREGQALHDRTLEKHLLQFEEKEQLSLEIQGVPKARAEVGKYMEEFKASEVAQLLLQKEP